MARKPTARERYVAADLDRDPLRWSRDQKLAYIAAAEAEEAAERCRQLESKGWERWYETIFGDEFMTNLADFHIEAIEWHWKSVVLRRAGLSIEKSTYPAIWFRGGRKSNIIRAIVVCDACVMVNGYALYMSSTKNKVRGHAISVESLINSDRIREFYPRLAQVKRNMQGAQKSWTADLMYADSGYVFHFVGLTEGVAGANIDDVRPTIIVGDDLDEREDSPLISDTRMKVFTRSVLPTRQRNTLVFIAQNYISRHGVVYKIHTGQERVLTNRVDTEPIPAVYNLVTEPRTIDGIVHDVIVSGEPSWPWYDLKRAQEEIDTIGLNAFEIECQHNVNVDKSALVLPEYDDERHPITWEHFNARYGLHPDNRDVPAHWRRYVSMDWGSSGEEGGHACVVLFFAVASANSPLASTVFLYKSMTFGASVLAGTVAHAILNFVLDDLQSDHRTRLELGLLDRSVADPSDRLAARTREKVVNELARREQWCMWHASHEARAVRDIHRMVYGLCWQPCRPRKEDGIEQMRHYLRLDYNEPHPFIPNQTGHGRMFLIVRDEDERTHPDSDDGHRLVRKQYSEWRRRPPQLTAKGYLPDAPLKQDDDAGNASQMVFTHFNLRATPLTAAEEFESRIPVESRYSTLLEQSPFERGLTPDQELQLIIARAHARKQQVSQVQRWDELGDRIS